MAVALLPTASFLTGPVTVFHMMGSLSATGLNAISLNKIKDLGIAPISQGD